MKKQTNYQPFGYVPVPRIMKLVDNTLNQKKYEPCY